MEQTTLTPMERADSVRKYARQTTGSSQWFKHWTGLLKYTEGVKYLADTCGAHWLIDLVASWQTKPDVRKERFQVWRLRVKLCPSEDPEKDPKLWIIDAWTDTPEDRTPGWKPSERLCRQEIEYSDFPVSLCPFEFWVENGVMLLKEEH